MDVPKKAQDQLQSIKEQVQKGYEAFRPNFNRFNEFRKFIFDTSLTEDDVTLLTNLSKPQIEFNIVESYISRQMGEFSKQEPSICVSSLDEEKADPQMVHIVEQHLRYALLDSSNHHTRYEIYKDIMSGGFSVGKVYTDYEHEMSMRQILCIDRVYDPTLCVFDQLARYSHKGDGQWCAELFPYEIELFKEQYPKINVDKILFSGKFSGFNWSYLNGNVPIILVCDYYKKRKKKTKIVDVVNYGTMTYEDYKQLGDSWSDITQVPAIKGKPRWTDIEYIDRYRCIENQVIEYTETDYKMLPLVFFDGNSILIKSTKAQGNIHQMTRPYAYHTMGLQKLINFSGITLANEMENMVMHKFKVAKEALPKEEDWLQAYKSQQVPSILVYNSFMDNDPDKPINNPVSEIQRVPTPPEVMATFTGAPAIMQNILGSYDSAMGIQEQQLSGIAVVESATQSNNAAMPFIVGFLQGLQRIAEIYVDLLPKYYTTPRTIPIMSPEGQRSYIKINQQNGINIDYESNVLNVKIEAGVSFAIQKSKALSQIIALMQASQQFAQFMNERGLPILLDNIEIRGIDQLRLVAEDWMKEQAQLKQQAMQMQQQQAMQNPMMMKAQLEQAKMQQDSMKSDRQFQIDMAKLKQDESKLISDALISQKDNETQLVKAETERFSKQVELQLQHKDMKHRHMKEAIETHHKLTQPRQERSVNENT